MDMILLALLILAVALAAAALSTLSPLEWARRELDLLRARHWMPPAEIRGPGTMDDPRVAAMVVKQRAFGKRLRRQGRTLHNPDKRYVPVLTKPAEPPRPKADKVVPIRRRTRVL